MPLFLYQEMLKMCFLKYNNASNSNSNLYLLIFHVSHQI